MARGLKGPIPIQQVVAHRCSTESEGISYVFVQAKFLLADPGDPKINDHTGKPHQAEPKEFRKKIGINGHNLEN